MSTFVLVHVIISLVGILSGLVVVFGLIGNLTLCRWTALFLATTVLTSVTGFMLPAHHFMPSHAVGIVSLVSSPWSSWPSRSPPATGAACTASAARSTQSPP
jgi:hypothetical protein